MTLDTGLGLLGAATGLAGIYLAYFFYKKSIRTKVLAIAYTDPIPLMMTLGDLEVVYEGARIKALSRIYVLLWNRGTAPIEASDFVSPIAITSTDPILKLKIHDKDATAAVVLDEASRSFTINLLRPGEAISFVVEVTSETYRPEIQVQMKSADMSTFISGLHSLYPGVAAFLVAAAIMIAQGITIYSWGSGIPSPTSSPFPDVESWYFFLAFFATFFVFGILFCIIPISFGVMTERLTKRYMSQSITPVAWKFFEFKISAWTMRLNSKNFERL